MAYARYDRDCDWYIFWVVTKADEDRARKGYHNPKEEEQLAIWHTDHRADGPQFSYAAVIEMIGQSNYSRIPGFRESDRHIIEQCLAEFVRDVDEEHDAAS